MISVCKKLISWPIRNVKLLLLLLYDLSYCVLSLATDFFLCKNQFRDEEQTFSQLLSWADILFKIGRLISMLKMKLFVIIIFKWIHLNVVISKGPLCNKDLYNKIFLFLEMQIPSYLRWYVFRVWKTLPQILVHKTLVLPEFWYSGSLRAKCRKNESPYLKMQISQEPYKLWKFQS